MTVPGDKLSSHGLLEGPGLYSTPIQQTIPVVAGRLVETPKAVYIENNTKRYRPSVKDRVVGIIAQRLGEVYKVNLQDHSTTVRLSHMGFAGASRKQMPNLSAGDAVYGRIVNTGGDMEAEMECFDRDTNKAGGFGPLTEGTIFSVTPGFARKLLFEGHPILDAIGAKYTFELAIGVNGRLWIKADSDEIMLKIMQWIQAAEKEGQAAVKRVR